MPTPTPTLPLTLTLTLNLALLLLCAVSEEVAGREAQSIPRTFVVRAIQQNTWQTNKSNKILKTFYNTHTEGHDFCVPLLSIEW